MAKTLQRGGGREARGRAKQSGRPVRRVGGRPRRPRRKAVLFAAVGAAVVAAMGWALLGSRLLVVRSVQVVGAGRSVSAAQVLAAAHVTYGLPLIRVNTGAIARQVERLRQVQYAQVSRDWPATVVISVQPRIPVFAVRVPGGYALVDRFGVSVRDVAAQPGLPLLTLANTTGASTAGASTTGASPTGSLRGSPAVRAAALVLRELPPRVARKVASVSAPGPSEVSVTLSDGVVVIWGNTARAGEKAKELTLLMRTRARSYDVSGQSTVMASG